MTMLESESFLLNICKNPRVLFSVYCFAQNQEAKTIEDISTGTMLSPSLVKEAVSVLSILNLIEKKYDVFQTVLPPLFTTLSSLTDQSFRLLILNRLAEKARVNGDWGKQAAYYLIYRYLVRRKQKIINPNDKMIVENLRIWFKEKGYLPHSQSGKKIRMNTQKLDNWAKLTAHNGTLLELQSNTYMTFIDPELFFTIMQIFQTGKNDASVSIDAFLKWCDIHFLPTYEDVVENPGTVPTPYSETIAELHISGKIELLTYGDYPSYRITESGIGERTPNQFNAFRCLH